MSDDYAGIFDEPKWADSNAFEDVFLMWRVKPELGLLVVPQGDSSEPRVIFCNLAHGGAVIFEGGLDHPEGSMTLSEARAALDRVEAIWKRGKGQGERG